MLIHNPIFTGSISLNGTDISKISTVSTDSSSFALRITNNESTSSAYVLSSGSFSTRTTNSENYISALNARTGSFATTGSNQFNGNQTVTGSLTATGTIIAQTLVVQTVTSSVVYSSGSNIFGLNSGNSHQFTGSVLVSGSITTNASLFSNKNIASGEATPLHLNYTSSDGSGPAIRLGSGVQGFWDVQPSSNNQRLSFEWNDSVNALSITSSGSVGIGTSTPAKLLTLYSSVGSLDTGAVIRLIGNTANDLVDISVADTKTRIYHQENSADADAGYGVIQFRTNASPNANFRTRGGFQFTLGSADAMVISNTYTIGMGIAPDAAKLSIQGVANEWALSVYANTTTSQAYGAIVRAGTNSNDISFRVNNAANDTTYFNVRGDGAATFSSTIIAGGTVTINNGGGVTATGNLSTNAGGLQIANGNQTSNTTCAQIEFGNRGYFSPANVGAATIRAISTGGNWYSGTALSFSTNPGPDVTAVSPVERMRITSGGNVLIGGSGDAQVWMDKALKIEGQRPAIDLVNNGNGTLNSMRWYGNSSSKELHMNWDFSGAIWSLKYNSYYLAGGAASQTFNGDGSVSFVGALTQNTSDSRVKKNKQLIPDALSKISTLSGITFEWDKDIVPHIGRNTDVGVIAQEIQAVLPDAVTLAPFDVDEHTGLSKSGKNYLTVYYEKIIPLLIEGIKELKAEIDILKQQ